MGSLKKVLNITKILIPALVVIFTVYYIFIRDPLLSEDQKNTIKLFGYPSQFVITYLPRGDADNPQLVRSETWYYAEQKTQLNFLAGKLVSEDEYIPDGEIENTPLKPEDFDFFLNFKDMSSIFGSENIIPIDFLPVFYEEGQTSTYITDLALFVMESDRLTYFQTLGGGAEDVLKLSEIKVEKPTKPEVEEDSEQSDKINTESWKTFQNTMLGIRMKYPPEWFLADGDIVLTTYDTGYMEKGLDLPEKRLKCDFNSYNSKYVEIEDEKEFLSGDIKISKGISKDMSGEEGPGMGDGVMFIFEEEDEDSVALICFSYSEEFEELLKESFRTFEFIDKDEE